MARFMLDSNILDKLLTSGSIPKGDYFIPTTVVEELASIPDCKQEKRKIIFLKLCELQATLVPVIMVINYSRVGYCVLANENECQYYDEICKEMKIGDSSKSHVKDAMIAVAAMQNDCVLVTEDILLRDTVKKLDHCAWSWDEFLLKTSER